MFLPGAHRGLPLRLSRVPDMKKSAYLNLQAHVLQGYEEILNSLSNFHSDFITLLFRCKETLISDALLY